MDFSSNALLNTQSNQPSFIKYMGISFGCHVVLFLLFLIGGLIAFHKKPPPLKFIAVDLVSLPDSGDRLVRNQATTSYRSKTKASIYKKPDNIPVPLDGEKLEPKTKKSLKKKTFNPDKSFNDTMKQLQQKVANGPPDSLTQALERLNSQVADQDSKAVRAVEHDQPGIQAGNPSGRIEAVRIYHVELGYKIRNNWVLPQQTAGKKNDLRAVIAIKVADDGRIMDMWFDHRSGNDYYDESVRKAILKSAPLPPLPPGYAEYTFGYDFTPSSLN